MSDPESKCPMSFTVVSPHGTIATASNTELHTKQDINDEKLNRNETSSTSAVFPFQRPSPFEPPSEYNRLRAEQPIYHATLMNGDKIWLITRYGDACLVLGDEEHFSKVKNHSDHANLLNLNPSERKIHRQILEKEFSLDRIKEFEPKIQIIVDNLLTELINQTPPVDFVSQFAIKVPSFIMYSLLGINQTDHQFLINRNNLHSNQVQTADKDLLNYVNNLIDKKKQTSESDLISRLVTEQLQSGKMNQKQLVDIILFLLQDGHELIKNQICFGLLSLLQHTEQINKLREDSSLIDNAVEEILRFHTVSAFATRRLTIQDVTIAGEMIKTGEILLVLNQSANRDDKVFTHPDHFDICRSPQHHLAFGYGIHQCIAMHFVRAQLKSVFHTIMQRLPNLQLAQSKDQIQFVTDSDKDISIKQMLVKW